MKKILYVTNIPTPYRTAFFNMIGKEYEVTVWYEYFKEPTENRDSSWEKDNAITYSAVHEFNFKNFRKFDLIVICGISTPIEIKAILFLKLFRLPYCIEVDGGFPKKDHFYKYIIKKFLVSGAKAYLSTAKMTDKYLLKYGANKDVIYRTRFSSVLNRSVIDHSLRKEEKDRIKRKLNLKCAFTALYVGRFLDWKGIDVLLKAAVGIPDLQILLIGGVLPPFLQKIIDENHLYNVTIIDFTAPESLKYYYQASDIFVFPSRDDIWGLVVNEAFANGLPVISSTGSIAGLELIDNKKNGYLFPVDNVEELRKIIITFMNLHDNKKIVMSEHAISTARQHTIEKMAEDHIRIFDLLLKR